jgi:hypothetical protein
VSLIAHVATNPSLWLLFGLPGAPKRLPVLDFLATRPRRALENFLGREFVAVSLERAFSATNDYDLGPHDLEILARVLERTVHVWWRLLRFTTPEECAWHLYKLLGLYFDYEYDRFAALFTHRAQSLLPGRDHTYTSVIAQALFHHRDSPIVAITAEARSFLANTVVSGRPSVQSHLFCEMIETLLGDTDSTNA